MKKALSNLREIAYLHRDRKTNSNYFVFESDDWGNERTDSAARLNALRKAGFDVDRCHYMLNDGIASKEDMEALFNTLLQLKDSKGNHPVLTANAIMANPDYTRIEQADYKEYFFVPFTESLKRYSNTKDLLGIWKEGIAQKVFYPQLHGREHLQVERWLHDLQAGNEETRNAFNMGMFAVSGHIVKKKRGSYLAAFDLDHNGSLTDVDQKIGDAVKIFESTFGFISRSFIAPNYVWNNEVEATLAQNGIKFLQGSRKQRFSKQAHEKTRTRTRFSGSTNRFSQTYMIRNVVFEPSSAPQKDWVGMAMKQIDTAFRSGRPAVLTSHRVNYVGSVSVKNRERGVESLHRLLKEVIKKWPEVEFIHSADLGKALSAPTNQ